MGADEHDWHHSPNRGNYGMLWLWDKLLGSDSEYRKWIASNKPKASPSEHDKDD